MPMSTGIDPVYMYAGYFRPKTSTLTNMTGGILHALESTNVGKEMKCSEA